MVINGLLFGLISTLHCAGMCGPLAMAIPGRVQNHKFLFAILYQTGRIGIYMLIGSLVFAIGYSFSLFRLQQVLSIGMGSLMLLFSLWTLLKFPVPAPFSSLGSRFLKRISGMIGSGRRGSALALGALNGLLPCGAIYIAAVYCASFSHAEQALAYMALFGLGTMPVFIAAWLLLATRLSVQARKLAFLYRYLPLLVGVLMILRGANLGIPYLSPEMIHGHDKTEIKNCCKH